MPNLFKIIIMLLIKKNNTAKWVTTLNEKAVCDLPIGYWLFVIKAEQLLEQNGLTIKKQLTDQSPTTKYNEFNIIEGIDLDLPIGDLDYFVFQMPNDTDIDEENGILVERGKLRVLQDIPTYIHNTENNTYIND